MSVSIQDRLLTKCYRLKPSNSTITNSCQYYYWNMIEFSINEQFSQAKANTKQTLWLTVVKLWLSVSLAASGLHHLHFTPITLQTFVLFWWRNFALCFAVGCQTSRQLCYISRQTHNNTQLITTTLLLLLLLLVFVGRLSGAFAII